MKEEETTARHREGEEDGWSKSEDVHTVPFGRKARPPGAKTAWLPEYLTKREEEVAELIGEGLTYIEIAARLFIQPSTVRAHTRKGEGKLGARNAAQLAVMYERLKVARQSVEEK